MSAASNEQVVHRYSEASVRGDLSAMEPFRHAGWWTEWVVRYPDERDYLCVSAGGAPRRARAA